VFLLCFHLVTLLRLLSALKPAQWNQTLCRLRLSPGTKWRFAGWRVGMIEQFVSKSVLFKAF
jgi:hypothetical protein